MSTTNTTVGRTLKTLREDAGLRQSDIARTSGLYQNVISRIESGKGNPSLRTLTTVASAVDAHVEIVADDDMLRWLRPIQNPRFEVTKVPRTTAKVRRILDNRRKVIYAKSEVVA